MLAIPAGDHRASRLVNVLGRCYLTGRVSAVHDWPVLGVHRGHYTLRIAMDSANLAPKDFREMKQAGFSKDEILEMIALAAYWNMNIVFSQAALAGFAEE
jgi:hypothetical protein